MLRVAGSFNPRPKQSTGIQQMQHDVFYTRFTRLDNGLVETSNLYVTLVDWHLNSGDSLHSLFDANVTVKGGTKLDQMAEENQTTWPLGRVSENGCAAGLERRQGPPVGGPWRSGSRAAQPATCEGRRQDGGAAASWRTCLLCARR